MDRVSLIGMSFFGHHGVSVAEQETGHRFEVDVDMRLDLSDVNDDVSKTVDYQNVYERVAVIVGGRSVHLIETLAQNVAADILSNHVVESITVRVRKAYPPIDGEVRAAEVEIFRRR